LSFRVIPVLDVRDGRALHAREGRRAEYRPVSSLLGPGADPLTLATGFRDRLGCREVYLADLGAIGGGRLACDILQGLAGLGLDVMADIGLRDAPRAIAARTCGARRLVAATETLHGAGALADIVAEIGPGAVLFGLDLLDGLPRLAPGSSWPDARPEGLIDTAVAAGVRGVVVLDLARVGSGRGIGTLDLVARLRRRHPDLELLVGGGVTGPSDLLAARNAGADGALVASALHDGRLGALDIAAVTSRSKG
jgi:phosphoribosylformimino-5-aminoimidazole carboxamide ribotide isomerase